MDKDTQTRTYGQGYTHKDTWTRTHPQGHTHKDTPTRTHWQGDTHKDIPTNTWTRTHPQGHTHRHTKTHPQGHTHRQGHTHKDIHTDKDTPTRTYTQTRTHPQGPTFSDGLQHFHWPVVHRLRSWLTFPWTSLLPSCRLRLLRLSLTLTLTLLGGTLGSNQAAGSCRQWLASLRLRAGVRRKASQLSRSFLACGLARPWLLAVHGGGGGALRICTSSGCARSLPSCHNTAC